MPVSIAKIPKLIAHAITCSEYSYADKDDILHASVGEYIRHRDAESVKATLLFCEHMVPPAVVEDFKTSHSVKFFQEEEFEDVIRLLSQQNHEEVRVIAPPEVYRDHLDRFSGVRLLVCRTQIDKASCYFPQSLHRYKTSISKPGGFVEDHKVRLVSVEGSIEQVDFDTHCYFV